MEKNDYMSGRKVLQEGACNLLLQLLLQLNNVVPLGVIQRNLRLQLLQDHLLLVLACLQQACVGYLPPPPPRAPPPPPRPRAPGGGATGGEER